MPALAPEIDVFGATPPSGVFLADALAEVNSGTAYRLPRWLDGSTNGFQFDGGGSDNTNPRVDLATPPYGHRCVGFAKASPYLPFMITPAGTTGASFWTAGAKTCVLMLYVNSCVTNAAVAAQNEGIISAAGPNQGWGLYARTNGGKYYLYLANYSAAAWQSASVEIALQTWYCVAMFHNAANQLRLYVWNLDGGQIGVDGGAWSVNSAATDALNGRIVLGRNGLATPVYSDCRIAELRMWKTALTPSQGQLEQVAACCLSGWGTRGDPVEEGRHTGSLTLQLCGKPAEIACVPPQSRVELLDHKLGDDIPIRSDRTAPDQSGIGMGDSPWQQRAMRVSRIEFDPKAKTIVLKGPTLRNRSTQYVLDFGRLDLPGSQWDPGCMRLAPSGVRTAYGRPSIAWLPRPSDGLVDRVAPHVLGLDSWGARIETCARNHPLNSSAALQNASWSRADDAAHGGSLTATATLETGCDLFTQDVTKYGWRVVHGSGAGKTDQTLSQTISTIVAGLDYVLSASWALVAPSLKVSRASDGWYWNDAAGWQAASCVNLCGGTPNARGIARHQTKPIPMDGSAVTVTVVWPAALPDAAVSWLLHVQLEDRYDVVTGTALSATHATSHIPTGAALVVRHPPSLSAYCSSPFIDGDHGTLLILFRPLWTDAALDAGGVRLFFFLQIADPTDYYANGVELYYASSWGGAHEWRAQFSRGGLLVGAATLPRSAAPVTRHTWHALALTWSGAAGEHGRAYVRSIYVDGVRGTDLVDSAPLVLPSWLFIGGPAFASPSWPADADIRRFELLSECLSAEEVALRSAEAIAQATAETPLA